MTSERDQLHLEYVLQSIDLIGEYTAGSRRRFEEEVLVQDTVLRRLETLADAASRLPQALKDRHPQIPWRDVQDFRNVAAHAYTGIDLDIVWRIVAGDLATLRQVVRAELQRIGRNVKIEG